MAFLTLEDRTGSLEIVVFSKQFETYRRHIEEDSAICVVGTVSRRDSDRAKVLLNSAAMLLTDDDFRRRKPQDKPVTAPKTQSVPQRSAPPKAKAPTVVYIRVPSKTSEIYRKCENIVEIFEGTARVSFYFADTASYVDHPHGFDICNTAIAELRRLAGDDSVVLR